MSILDINFRKKQPDTSTVSTNKTIDVPYEVIKTLDINSANKTITKKDGRSIISFNNNSFM